MARARAGGAARPITVAGSEALPPEGRRRTAPDCHKPSTRIHGDVARHFLCSKE